MSDLPEVTVTATRYTVSLLPADDINFTAYALYVQRRKEGWGITDGAAWVVSVQCHWSLDYYDALVLDDLDKALAMARKLAPRKRVNGITAAEAYRRTHPTG